MKKIKCLKANLECVSLWKFIKLSLLYLFVNYSNLASPQEFPLVSNCNENSICTCERLNSLKHLNEKQVKQILDTLQTNSVKDTALLACCYHQLAVNAYYNDKLIQSLNYNKKAEQLRLNFNDDLLLKSQLNIGINYYDLDEYKLAAEYLLKSYSLKRIKRGIDSINIFRNLGNCYAYLGEFKKAIEYGKLAAKINLKDSKEDIYHAKNDLSSNLIETKDNNNIKLAIKYSIDINLQSTDVDNKIYSLNNLGRIYLILKKFDQSLNYYIKSTDLAENDTLHKAIILNNIGVLYADKYLVFKDASYKNAIDTLNTALNLFKAYYGEDTDYNYTACYENLADIYIALQHFDTALLHYQKSIINLTNNFRNENIFQNPNSNDSTLFIYSNPDIIRVLHLKATAAHKYYQQNKEEKYLTLANQTYQTAFDFHDKLQKDISTENSRLFQAKNIVSYIENALKIAFQQQENGQTVSKAAFRFMEKNKATVLLQSMNEADALQYANLPDSLLEQERDFKIAITFHQKQLNDAIEYEEVQEIKRLNALLFNEKQQYHQLINNLENNYPSYYRLKYQQNKTQLADVQNTLDDKTALLEYFVGDSSIYILSLQKNYSKLYQLKKPPDWKKTIDGFRQSITNTNQDIPALFTENGHQLYNWLLSEPLCDLQAGINRLQIIPDAELSYIPFEILLSEKIDTHNIEYKKLPYLLKGKSIGYAYSAALLLESKETEASQKTFPYGGYAPIYYEDDTIFYDLPITRDTVKALASLLNGKAYINEAANLPQFLKDDNSYKILHLGMHGVLNNKNSLSSYLAFTKKENFKLHAYDLYNQKLNTELAILHACDTGTGELEMGEGVMSLSRAFTYAGCPSLVMSLWSIPEKATSKITQMFIINLTMGLPKDAALQQAKLDYLREKPEREASPAYWAGLVVIGNLSPLDFN